MICDYGCGKEAIHQFKNGKWCCSKDAKQCKTFRSKISISRKKYTGKNHPRFGKEVTKEQREKVSQSNKKWNLENEPIWKGRKHTNESKKKIGLKSLGRKHDEEFKERLRKRLLNGDSIKMNSFPRDPEKMKKFKEDRRNWMLENGSYVKSFIKKISNEEMNLRDMVKELYPDADPQHKVLNYFLDVALINEKIAIEYDGYYHFDTEDHKQYYKHRQEKIESNGWKFYRVTMFDKFPNIKEVENKIKNLIKDKNESSS